MNRCLASALSQVGHGLYLHPSPGNLVSWVHHESTISGVLYVSSGELISGCDPPGRCQPSRIPGRLSNWEPARSLVEDAVSEAEFAPHLLALAVAPHLPPVGDGPVRCWLALL